jgi:hypothetical protein
MLFEKCVIHKNVIQEHKNNVIYYIKIIKNSTEKMFLVAKILASFVPYCLITVNNLKRKIG